MPLRPLHLPLLALILFGPGAGSGQARQADQYRPVEKRNPTAAFDVVHPIVFRIDSTVPRKWVPWITRGIEAWNPAFQAIGSGHAIVVQDGARPVTSAGGQSGPACTVRWTTEYFDGAATIIGSLDSRTGEVSNCDMTLNNGTIGLAQDYAFLYLGGLDPRMHYPYPDSISGRLLQMMVSHEAGHSLGFTENFDAGTVYPTDSLRNAAFVHRVGTVASIMSYTFFDAVAQPEDHVGPEDLIARPGEYDQWALGTVYGSDSVRASAARPQSLVRWPALTGGAYAIGRDLVKSAEYVSRNLARTVPLIDAQRDTSGILPGGSSLQERLRGDVVTLWAIAITSAIDATVGGTVPQPSTQGTPPPAVPVDSARQVEALRFAIAHVVYGRDPFVQAALGRAPTDTALLLFDTVPAGWTVKQWQDIQDALVSHLVGRDRAAQIASQAGTTHVRPAYCAELATLDRALTAAAAKATSPEARNQAERLRDKVHRRFDPEKGVCAAPASPKP